MEEKPIKVSAKSSGHHDSGKLSLDSDVGNLRTTATQSQSRLNLPLTNVCEDSDLEGSSRDSKTGQWYNQKTSRDTDGEEWDGRSDKLGFKQEEMEGRTLGRELHPHAFQGSDLEEDKGSKTKTETSSSVTTSNISRRTPHRAYWVEQQNRLPLPLVELMESEALEILTKALQSYRSGIGKDHFLTKQLQRYIEGLKKRRNKRQQVLAH